MKPPDSNHTVAIRAHFDSIAPERRSWRDRSQFLYQEDERYLQFCIPPGASVLDIGCGIGDTLARLKPLHGVGVDLSGRMIEEARRAHSEFTFVLANAEDCNALAKIEGTFDYILLSDTIGFADDCQKLLENLHRFCRRETRVVLSYYSHLWESVLKLAEWLGLRARQAPHNVLSGADVNDFANMAGFEPIKSERRLLCPLRLFGLGRLVNRFIAPLPIISHLSLRHYTICRSLHVASQVSSATVVIPALNERGNIEPAVRRLPNFCDNIEIIFVAGHSKDGTYEEMQRVARAFPDHNIKVMKQPGKGKADAVFFGFDAAQGDVLMILDADLTMPPEQLPKFWGAIVEDQAEFANGSRLVYSMDKGAMRFLNLLANRLFSFLFTWLISQRITDTLCGTKVMRRSDYRRLKANRLYFGDFDPFGDFDLIFGASKLALKIRDIPIRYAARRYGETQISRFSHGLLLFRMVIFAFLKIKAL